MVTQANRWHARLVFPYGQPAHRPPFPTGGLLPLHREACPYRWRSIVAGYHPEQVGASQAPADIVLHYRNTRIGGNGIVMMEIATPSRGERLASRPFARRPHQRPGDLRPVVAMSPGWWKLPTACLTNVDRGPCRLSPTAPHGRGRSRSASSWLHQSPWMLRASPAMSVLSGLASRVSSGVVTAGSGAGEMSPGRLGWRGVPERLGGGQECLQRR